jgi:hypothetical protein
MMQFATDVQAPDDVHLPLPPPIGTQHIVVSAVQDPEPLQLPK